MIAWGGLVGFAFLGLLVLKRAMPNYFRWLNASFGNKDLLREKVSERPRDEKAETRVRMIQNTAADKFAELGQAEGKFYFAYQAIQTKPLDSHISETLRPDISQIKNESADIVSIDAYRKKSNG